MSQENVEVVRRFFEAIAQAFDTYWRNPRSLEAAMRAGDLPPEVGEGIRYLDPDVEWHTVFAGVSFRGHLDCARGWDWLLEAAESYSVSLREVADLGGDQVLAVVDRAFKAKSSEIELNAPVFSVVTMREGLIIRMDEFSEHGEALEAVG
jgi:ketosteroid isomerase-like protein